MTSRIIIIVTIVLLLASFSALFFIEARNHDYDYNKSWSVVYFLEPKNGSLDFAIENHEGASAEYAYNISIGDGKVIDEKIEINAGATQKISPVIPSERLEGNDVVVKVRYRDKEYMIDRNFGK